MNHGDRHGSGRRQRDQFPTAVTLPLMVLVFAAALIGGVSAQGQWREFEGSTAPLRRSAAGMAYDADRGRVVMVSGNSEAPYVQDTWEWDGSFWNLRARGVVAPPPGVSCAAYDSFRRQVVVFPQAFYPQTWLWDGNAWTSTAQTPNPSDLFEGKMVFDQSRARCVLVGNQSYVGLNLLTWEWDGSQWTQVTPSGPSPAPRRGHSLVYDPVRKRTILFGGTTNTVDYADTWEWDGVSWTSKSSPTNPPARSFSGLAFDPVAQKLLLHGGRTKSFAYFPDTWTWNGANWTKLAPTSTPGARASFSTTTDSARRRIVLFGGIDSSGYLDDTWEWDGTSWLSRTEPKPPKLYQHGMAFDAASGRTLLFGGYSYETGNYYKDTWSFDGSKWKQLFPPSSPPPTTGEWMVSDTVRKRIVLYDASSGTWEWDGVTWTQRTAVLPLVDFAGAGLAFDASRGRTVMFCSRKNQPTIMDTWEWDGATWTQRTPSQSPPARSWSTMAYDEARARVVLYGGLQSQTVAFHDTWEWDGITWTQRFPATSFAGLMGCRMVYDRSRGKIVLFGGAVPTFPRLSYSAATWEWDGTNWSFVTTTFPRARWWFGMCYDPVLGQCVIAGGDGDDGRFWDTWLLGPTAAANVSPYGSGCPGGAGIPTLAEVSGSLPWLGETFRASLTNLGPTPGIYVPFFVLGDSKTTWGSSTLPLDLTSLGMPGCSLNASPLFSGVLTNAAGQAGLLLPIPNFASLVGATLYAQGGVTDPDANLLGVVLSNGSALKLGAR